MAPNGDFTMALDNDTLGQIQRFSTHHHRVFACTSRQPLLIAGMKWISEVSRTGSIRP